MSGHYAQAAASYRAAGWAGVLPLPRRRKFPPPDGYTGHRGVWPSAADVQAWTDGPEGAGNIALRLPADVVGIDVDNYGGKQGGATYADAVGRWGPLPPTWRSTNRDDGQGSILFFRVPEGLAWPGVLGAGVEIIQAGHRYAAVWPSVHPEGRTYRWVGPDGLDTTTLPRPDELPPLPDGWVTGLTHGLAYEDVPRAGLGDQDVSDWLTKRGDGDPCATMMRCLADYPATRFDGTESRHEAARAASHRIVRLAAEGHSGTTAALQRIEQAFTAAVQADPARPADPYEWRRMVNGAVQIAAAGPVAEHDPCGPPWMPGEQGNSGDGFALADSIEQETLEWLWPGWVPDRHVTVCEGDGGIGKSTVWVDLMARTTTGHPMPDGSPTRPGAVVYLTNEDDFATVTKGRLALAGADMAKVIVLDPARPGELSFPEDVDKLRRRIESHGVVLVVIDPWSAFMSPTLSNNSDQEFRRAIGPAQLLAQQLGVAVILLRHLRKGVGPARERGLGSVAIGNTSRSVMLFKTDPDDETGAVIVQHKQNLGAAATPLRYRVTSDNTHDPSRARVEWRGISPHTVADLIAVPEQEDDRTQTDECADWLEDYLRDHQYEAERKTIMTAAKADGFTWGDRVWRDARTKLHIDVASRTKTERPGTKWRLPIIPKTVVTSGSMGDVTTADVTTDVTTAPAQQIRGLQPPEKNSRDVAPPIGHDRSRLPADDVPTHCRTCGQPILLRRLGRDQCERCRLAEQHGEPS